MNTQTIFRPSAPLLRAWRFLPYLAQGLAACGQALRQGLLIGSAVLLVACGGGGGGGGNGDGDGDPGAPPAPTGFGLNAPTIKTLNFKWDAVAGATHYKLFEDVDGDGIGAEISGAAYQATSYAHETSLIYRLNAKYGVRSCNELGCSATSTLAIKADDLNAAIGYAKGANGGQGNAQYGKAIALSKDGNTLAVGAPYEDVDGINDAGAVYVIRRTAAGVWSAPQRLQDDTLNGSENFGRSVALSANGSVLAVGVPGGVQTLSGSGGTGASGHVKMFVFNASDSEYNSVDTVIASNNDEYDTFGISVALSDNGQVLAVGASSEGSAVAGGLLQPADNSAMNAGAVYIYSRSGNNWGDEQFLKASNASGGPGLAGDQFGDALALSGDGLTLAVGAFSEDGAGTGIFTNSAALILGSDAAQNAGAIYVFTRASVGAAFSNQVYIKASNTDAGDLFGSALALSVDGNTLVVGATHESSSATGVNQDESSNASVYSGAVYVFVRNGGTWSQQAYIKAFNTYGSSRFGSALALSSDGNTLAAGARGDPRLGLGLGANPQAAISAHFRGSAYVFRRIGGNWSQSAYLKTPSNDSYSIFSQVFGSSLAMSGDGSTLAVSNASESNAYGALAPNPVAGPPETDNRQALDSGAVFLF